MSSLVRIKSGFGALGCIPRGSINTTIMELGPQSQNGDGLLGPNSIIVVYMDPLGLYVIKHGTPKNGTGNCVRFRRQ